MIPYDFTSRAFRDFSRLPKTIQHQIIYKIELFLNQPQPLQFAEKLAGTISSYRFRITDYRVIFDWEGQSILITRVGHRKDIYRK